MTLDQFTQLLDRHGSGRAHWPASLRAGAEALLAASPEAAALLRQAERVEAVMRAHDPGRELGQDAVIRLSNSVLSQLPPTGARRRPRWQAALERLGTALGAGREWGPRLAVSMAAAAMLGMVTGGLLPTSDARPMSATELLAMTTTYLPLDAR